MSKELDELIESIRKAKNILKPRKPITLNNPIIKGIKLNSKMIDVLNVECSMSLDDKFKPEYLTGIPVILDETIDNPRYVVEGEIEKAIENSNLNEALKWVDENIDWNCKKIEELKNRDKGIADIYNNENKMLMTIKQVLIQANQYLGARRNGKTLEQMYQLVQKSKAPMKPSLWVARIDGKLEQRVVMEKEDYDKLQIKAKERDYFKSKLNIIIEKGVDVGYLKTCKTLKEYNRSCCYNDDGKDFNKRLTEEEFNSIKEVIKNGRNNS